MRARIFRVIFGVSIAVTAACFLLIMGGLYRYFSGQYAAELESEALYLRQGAEKNGVLFFDGLEVAKGQRITWIDATGVVMYDSKTDAAMMESHKDREEFVEAMNFGTGFAERYSSTFSERTLYYAVKLTDGTVLRVAGTQYSVWAILIGLVRPVTVVILLVIGASAFLASRLSKSIVRPINSIDPEHPEEAETYEELTPLLRRMSLQNREIEKRIDALKRARQEISAITENMAEGFLVVDRNTDLLSYNHSALKLLGAEKAETGQSVLTLNRSEQFRGSIEEAIKGKHSEHKMEMEGRVYQVIGNPVYRGRSIAGAVIVILDITEKEQREYLRREFTANVSHELKTPLTSISGFAEIIKNGLAKPEDTARFADLIHKEAGKLISLVGDIIRLSQLDEETMPQPKESVNLLELAQEVSARLGKTASSGQVELSVSGDSVSINGVRQILEEMIYNLCDNAIKYNRPGGCVNISVRCGQKDIEFIVTDTGIGIPQGEQKRVFERFYRVDKSHSKDVDGTGLGLSIVKHGAAYHKASVILDSVPDQGTTVRILFPKDCMLSSERE